MLNSLNGEWVIFQQTLLDSEQMLKKHKEKFKTGLIHSADDFKKKAHNLLEEFGTKGILSSFFTIVLMQSLKAYSRGRCKQG